MRLGPANHPVLSVRRHRDVADMWRTVADRLPVALATTGGERHIVRDVNTAYCQLVGRQRAEVIGCPLVETWAQPGDRSMLTAMDGVFRRGEPARLRDVPLHRPGHPPEYWTL